MRHIKLINLGDKENTPLLAEGVSFGEVATLGTCLGTCSEMDKCKIDSCADCEKIDECWLDTPI